MGVYRADGTAREPNKCTPEVLSATDPGGGRCGVPNARYCYSKMGGVNGTCANQAVGGSAGTTIHDAYLALHCYTRNGGGAKRLGQDSLAPF